MKLARRIQLARKKLKKHTLPGGGASKPLLTFAQEEAKQEPF